MPIYEYECGRCRCRFEMKQGFDEKPGAVCPECQGKARRILQSSPVIYRGSGFYVTDSRKGGDGGADKPKAKPAGEAEKPKAEAVGGEAGKAKGETAGEKAGKAKK